MAIEQLQRAYLDPPRCTRPTRVSISEARAIHTGQCRSGKICDQLAVRSRSKHISMAATVTRMPIARAYAL